MSRISELRRRDWTECDPAAVEEISLALNPSRQGELRLIQAMGIRECLQLGGVVLGARVGAGKTLWAGALATIYEDLRPLIVVKTGHLDKTMHEFSQYRAAGWQLSHKLQVVPYNEIARDVDEKLFRAYQPRMLICDEADALKNVQRGGSGTAARVNDYMFAYPETLFACATGTFYKSGIKDFGHMVNWALKGNAPIPRLPVDISYWHRALKGGPDKRMRNELGIGPDDDLKKAFRERFWYSPGVIISIDQFEGVQLSLTRIPLSGSPELQRLYDEGVSPNDLDVIETESEDAESIDGTWAVQRQLALDFYYKIDPEPPREWTKARRAYFRWVRSLILAGEAKTELQARRIAIRDGVEEYSKWMAIKPTFEPRFAPVWLGDRAINVCKEWGKDGGIIWTDHRAFAERLSHETGWRWFAGGGLDVQDGSMIEKCHDKTIIASRQANSTGRNLQTGCGPNGEGWHRGLVTAMPPNGRDAEQLFGRLHREGQRYDVEFSFLMGCRAHANDLRKVIQLSREEQEEMGRTNKILTAAWR